MTTTFAPPAPYAPARAEARDYLPAVAAYDTIAPTTANMGFSFDTRLRSFRITSSQIESMIGLVAGAAIAWVAATAPPRQRSLILGGLLGAASAHVVQGVLAPDQTERELSVEAAELRDNIEREGGLSRQEIATILGVDRRSLSGWASGETRPTQVNLRRLRCLAELARALSERGVPELNVALGDAKTAEAIIQAVRAVQPQRALVVALGTEPDVHDEAEPSLTEAQSANLLRLLNAQQPRGVDDEIDEPSAALHPSTVTPLRVRLDRAAYATPRRPRRPAQGG